VFRRYIGTQVYLSLTSVASPFFGLYAKNVLGAPDGMVGVYVAVRAAALLIFNLPWGYVSDRKGNRLVLRLMTLGNGLAALLALIMVAAVSLLQLHGPWLPYLAIPIFLLSGAVVPAQMLVGSNFLLELVPEVERPLYMGVSNTLIGSAMVLSGLGGGLADLFGFAGVFGATVALLGLAYGLANGLPEPRQGSLRSDGG
jgi:MFS family permease